MVDPDSENAIKASLLTVGLSEFAHYGFDGARIERVAAQAGCAKRMVYYYFGGKEGFYLAVLNHSYRGIRNAERALDLEAMPAGDALRTLIRESFYYHEQNIEFSRLVLMENLQNGRMMRQMDSLAALRGAALLPLAQLLERGVREGVFRDGVDPADVHYMISALSSYRLDHAATWQSLLHVDLGAEPVRTRHLDLALRTVMSMVCIRE